MFKQWAKDISLMLIANNIITFENREAYSYGIELFLFKTSLYIIVGAIALITHTLIPSAIFVVSYMLLRQYSGGYHCKTAETCMIVSILMYLIFLLLYKLDYGDTKIFFLISSLVSFLPIAIFSPVENINNPLTIKEKKKYHIIAVIIVVSLIAIMLLSYYFTVNNVFYAVSYALTADSVLIILGLRRNKNEETCNESNSSDG